MRTLNSTIILHEIQNDVLIKTTPLPVTNLNYKRFITARRAKNKKLEIHYFDGSKSLLKEIKKDSTLKDIKIYLP